MTKAETKEFVVDCFKESLYNLKCAEPHLPKFFSDDVDMVTNFIESLEDMIEELESK